MDGISYYIDNLDRALARGEITEKERDDAIDLLIKEIDNAVRQPHLSQKPNAHRA